VRLEACEENTKETDLADACERDRFRLVFHWSLDASRLTPMKKFLEF